MARGAWFCNSSVGCPLFFIVDFTSAAFGVAAWQAAPRFGPADQNTVPRQKNAKMPHQPNSL